MRSIYLRWDKVFHDNMEQLPRPLDAAPKELVDSCMFYALENKANGTSFYKLHESQMKIPRISHQKNKVQ